MPVATTRPRAFPCVTLQPENTISSGVSFVDSRLLGFATLATSSDSPVKGISSTLRSEASSSRRSAGATSPVPRTTMSPRTIVLLATTSSLPSRRTVASGCVMLDSASRALPAEFSVAAAMPALRITMTRMAIAEGMDPIATDATAAKISRMMMTFVSCMRKSLQKPGLFDFASSLRPSSAKRLLAVASGRPWAGSTLRATRRSWIAAPS
mmetsp:Transcript_73306/g.131999  ORF Transcript_73306/g.131999 Transcript_73306/m.131999 type:complete len:210 (-) Transcript_73306:268-897(-)